MADEPRILVDERRDPIIVVTWPDAAVSDGAFEEMLSALSRYSRRGKPYVVIHDARRAVRPTPKQRARAAEVGKADEETSRKWLRGSAVVVDNPALASVLTAIQWVFRAPFPQKSFKSMADAEAWVAAQLAAK